MNEVVKPLQQHVERQLATLLQCHADGGDTAPSKRSRLEGWMEAALLLAGGDAQSLVARWQLLLPARARLLCDQIDDAWRVRLDIWQARAPVKPSTRD